MTLTFSTTTLPISAIQERLETILSEVYAGYIFDSTTNREENEMIDHPAGNCYGLLLKVRFRAQRELEGLEVNVVPSDLYRRNSTQAIFHVAGIVAKEAGGTIQYILLDAGVNKHRAFSVSV